jgi:hypothetical protein
MKTFKQIFDELSAEMPYKWRQSFDNQKRDLAYVDARDVQNRLDEVLGMENWQCKYTVCPFKYTKATKDSNGQKIVEILDSSTVICSIGINIGRLEGKADSWIWKEGNGTETNIENEKGAFSDAFKRSAVLFGVGRFLYSIKGKSDVAVKKTAETKTPADTQGLKHTEEKKETLINNTAIASESQLKLLYVKAEQKQIPADAMKHLIKTVCGVESSKLIPKNKFNDLLKEIDKI